MFKKIKINIALVCVGLIFGLAFFVFTVTAKTDYKTLAFDKKIETKQDFAKGKLKNIKLEEKTDGAEISLLSNESGEYISPVIQAPFKANYIGLHWKEQLADGALITAYIRTSNDGENFSEWVKTTADRDGGRDGRKEDETFAALVGSGKAEFAQAKIEFISEKKISPKLNTLIFTFINSGEESKQVSKKLSFTRNSIAENIGIQKISPNGQSINVISREEWGADESYRLIKRGRNVTEDWPRSYHGTRKIIIHHTAGLDSNGVTSLETNKATVRAIYHYHAITRRWGDIGYNALVDAAGNIYEGRYGTHGEDFIRSEPTSDDVMVLDVEGAHAASYNSGSFGVSAMGDFTEFEVPIAQLEGLKKAIAFVADSRGINVLGNSDFLRYDGAWHNNLNNVIGHRDVGATACPGNELYAKIGAIKDEVNNFFVILSNISGFSATLNLTPISGTSVGLGTINFSWNNFSDNAQYQYALEKVFGTIYDPQPWETTWMNGANTIITSDISIEVSSLDPLSQYVFYVRAIDDSGKPLSAVSHVNFTTNDFVVPDVEVPIVKINAPDDEASIGRIVTIEASATDNVGVTSMKLYIDENQVAVSSTGSLNYRWNTNKISSGDHTIEVIAFDVAGNEGSDGITVTK